MTRPGCPAGNLDYNRPIMVEPGEPLSTREQEVVCLLATGATNRMIAHQLGISPNTVKVHLRNVFAKLGISSRTEATVIAIRRGWIEMPQTATGEKAAEPGARAEAVPAPDAAEEAVPETVAIPPLPWLKRVYLVLSAVVVAAVTALTWPSAEPIPAETCDNEFTADCPTSGNGPTVSEPESLWVSAARLPVPRGRFALASLGGRLFVIGGETDDGVVGSTAIYEPAADQWTAGADKPTAASNLAAGVLGNRVYVPGGGDPQGEPLSIVEIYDPAADTWSDGASMPTALAAYAAAVWHERLYLFGGWDGRAYTDNCWVFDPADGRWRTLPPLPTPRGFAAAAATDTYILVMGGYDGRREFDLCERFDPLEEMWQSCAPMSNPRGGLGAAAVAGQVYAVGGGWRSFVTFSERFNPASDIWRNVETPLLLAGGEWRNLGVATVGTRVYAMGGWQRGRYLDVNQAYETLPNRLYLPAAISR